MYLLGEKIQVMSTKQDLQVYFLGDLWASLSFLYGVSPP